MIYFQTVRYQNLLSTGNLFTEIQLNKNNTTLIIGPNGSGKSTLIEAITYVLYGKPFRNINKPQLCNSITNKGLLVEIEFLANNKQYLVRRGMKPNVFEIIQDGLLINQNSDIKGYQDMLEKTILKMNYKTFGQIVILGTANYTPFMRLTPADRRMVVEDLLDIQIFSVMSNLLTEKLKNNKQAILEKEHELKLLEQKLELKLKHVKSLQTNNKELIDRKKDLITKLKTDINTSQKSIDSFMDLVNEKLETISDKQKVLKSKNKLLEMETDLENKRRSLTKELSFFSEHDNCPTCKQEIDLEFKESTISKKTSLQEKTEETLRLLEDKVKEFDLRLSEISDINEEISELQREISIHTSDIRSWTRSVDTLQEEIDSITSNTSQIDVEQNEIDTLKLEYKEHHEDKKELFSTRDILDISSNMLKDTGIKTRIIRQYVPIINKLVNKYLASLDFFVNFELDDKFNESIKSRFRDEFTYASFSEGEKSRLDIALMLAWRSIAKLRNSASTNLLILDETLDSSLDSTGVDELFKIINTIEGSNIFIISHKGDSLHDHFENVIKFEKHSNFSRISE